METSVSSIRRMDVSDSGLSRAYTLRHVVAYALLILGGIVLLWSGNELYRASIDVTGNAFISALSGWLAEQPVVTLESGPIILNKGGAAITAVVLFLFLILCMLSIAKALIRTAVRLLDRQLIHSAVRVMDAADKRPGSDA